MVRLVDNKASNFGHACSGYSIDDKEVTLHFDNQADQKADVLIAVRPSGLKQMQSTQISASQQSDGVKSRIRKCLYERKGLDVASQTARYAEWVAWRGQSGFFSGNGMS